MQNNVIERTKIEISIWVSFLLKELLKFKNSRYFAKSIQQ